MHVTLMRRSKISFMFFNDRKKNNCYAYEEQIMFKNTLCTKKKDSEDFN